MSNYNPQHKCKKCGHPLTWVDTYETEIELEDKTFKVWEFYECEHCQIDYNVFTKGTITPNNVKISES